MAETKIVRLFADNLAHIGTNWVPANGHTEAEKWKEIAEGKHEAFKGNKNGTAGAELLPESVPTFGTQFLSDAVTGAQSAEEYSVEPYVLGAGETIKAGAVIGRINQATSATLEFGIKENNLGVSGKVKGNRPLLVGTGNLWATVALTAEDVAELNAHALLLKEFLLNTAAVTMAKAKAIKNYLVYLELEIEVTASSFSRSTSDSVGVSESVSRVLGLVRTPSDTVGLVEAVERTATFARSTSDSVSVSEAVEHSRGVTRETTDSVGVAESVSRKLGLVRTPSDSVGISEAVSRLAGLVRPTSDTVSVSEVVGHAVGRARSSSDTVTVSTAVSRLAGLVRSTSDSVSPAGVVSRVLHLLRSAADSISIVEAIRVEHHGAAPFAFFARWVDEAELAGGWRRTAALPVRFVVGQVLRVKQEVVRP